MQFHNSQCGTECFIWMGKTGAHIATEPLYFQGSLNLKKVGSPYAHYPSSSGEKWDTILEQRLVNSGDKVQIVTNFLQMNLLLHLCWI